jgi:hypothetical protein
VCVGVQFLGKEKKKKKIEETTVEEEHFPLIVWIEM